MPPIPSAMAELMKKSVAIGIAGVTAVVLAAWRQVQKDNTLATDSPGSAGAAPAPDPEPAPQPLFSPSVDENSTKAEIYEVATELGIEGRSKMNKTELLKAIRSAS